MPAKSDAEFTLSREEIAACDEAIRLGSKSFHAASLLLPRETRRAARALYSFCRSSDDLVDDGNAKGYATAMLAERLDAIYARSPHPAVSDRAFASVVYAHHIPRIIPDALIEGFVWDEQNRTYETLDDLLAYAARVASTVGVMMARIMGCTDAQSLARAADLGLAMQLTNIARDVGEDAARGRVYLPTQWLADEGLAPQDLIANPRPSTQTANVIARLLKEADRFYRLALSGVASLPLGCRPAIRSAALIYREIGREIIKNNYDSLTRRASTTTRKKLELIAIATALPFPLVGTDPEAAHPSVAFLVDAAAQRPTPEIKSFDQAAGRMLELMARAEYTRHSNR